MPRIKDISQQRFGAAVALKADGKDATGKTMWLCLCDCGNYFASTMLNLCSGNTKSCGCLRNRSKRVDHEGLRYGRHLVESYVDMSDGIARWSCLCDCGGRAVVKAIRLTTGKTKSCGCIKQENSVMQARKNFNKSGANHPRWKPDLTDSERNRHRSDEIRKWSRLVKEFYNFTCQRCYVSGGKLQSHHILPYSTHKNNRLDVHNGMCLCVRCHREFHATYGYTKFNENDIIEFIIESIDP